MDAQPQLNYIDGYKYLSFLGDGGQASVYLCSKDGRMYAAKVFFPGQRYIAQFKKEIEFLSVLNHANLVKMIESKQSGRVKLPGLQQVIRPIIFLQFAEGGQLFQFIYKEGRLPPQICKTLVNKLISVIEYLQNTKVAHRDLKTQNILLDKNYNIIISDFGFSAFTEGQNQDGILHSRLGTQGYRPPQMQLGRYTGLQADLFATGVILFILYSGNPPFMSTKNSDRVYRLIHQRQFDRFWQLHQRKKPEGFFSNQFKVLMNSFFASDIQHRPTLENLKGQNWLTQGQASQKQLYEEMNRRHQRILANDANKQAIERIKLQFYKDQLAEQMRQQQQKKRMMDIEQQKKKRHKEAGFNKQIVFPKIKVEDLQVSHRYNLIGANVHPSLLIAWISDFIDKSFADKNIFIEDPVLSTEPYKYYFDYNPQTHKIIIHLAFKITDSFLDLDLNKQEQQELEEQKPDLIQQIGVEGQLVRLPDGKVAIEWLNGKGNFYWLANLYNQLDSRLKALI